MLVPFLAHAQQNPPPPPPCGEKGVPDNVPCYDSKSGKVIHTESPTRVPSTPLTDKQKAVLNGTTPEPKPVETPKFEVPKTEPVKDEQQVHFPNTPQNTDPTPTATSPQSQETNPSAAQQRRDYQAGYTLGQGLGNAIYNARLRHAISKACNKGAEGWRLPSGQVIMCSDWKRAHPNRR